MPDRSINREIWATLEDTYAHDTVDFGPFPDLASAHRFCDAKNRQIVENVRKEIGQEALLELFAAEDKSFGVEPDPNNPKQVIGLDLRYRLGSWVRCLDYDQRKAIANFILHPPPGSIDAEAEARALGCKWKYEWLEEKINQMTLDHCWCADLQAGHIPEVSNDEMQAFLFTTLQSAGYIFTTTKHRGELYRLSCPLCGAAVLGLYIELEGYGDSEHSFYTFPTSADLEALDKGKLGPKSYESYVESRCGIHKIRSEATFYKQIKVGYLGYD